MPLETNFDANLDGYTGAADAPYAVAEWNGVFGNPSLGCAKMTSKVPYVETPPVLYYGSQITNIPSNYVITDNAEKLWFNARIQSNIDMRFAYTNNIFSIEILYNSVPLSQLVQYMATGLLNVNGYDSGWLQFSIPLAWSGHIAGDVLGGLAFYAPCGLGDGSYNGQEITIYFDSIEFSVSTPAFSPGDTPTPGGRLWIFKSTDGGLSWTSRGVTTP